MTQMISKLLELAGSALSLICKITDSKIKPTYKRVFISLVFFVVIAGAFFAFSQTSETPSKSEINIQQTVSGDCTVAMMGVQGDVNITGCNKR
jgi:hypothetical protein